MYSDSAKKRRMWIALLVLLVIIAAVVLFVALRRDDLSDKSAGAIKEAVQRCALQCYVVEGVYPPNLAYMEDNYGLQINHDDFYVTYDAFASNIPPTVIVTVK